MTLLIRERDLEGAPKLQRPLNDAFQAVEARLQALETQTRVFLIENVTLRTGGSVAAGTLPFPLRLGLPQGVTLAGLLVLKAENSSTAGNTGIPANGVVVNAWHQEGPSVVLDFVTGLATNTTYRLTLGGFRAI